MAEVQVLFLPKYACWLNLIAPFWKQWKSLALVGRRFETLDELPESLFCAVDYWNAHGHPYVWKKWPQEQVVLGGLGIGRSQDILTI